ncbi:MAG: hypothetical protein WBA77_07430 [Microcoleaceae cyanobacterium]
MSAKLVPLNIPSGWAVVQNNFGDQDPLIQNGWIVNHDNYSEHLLSIRALNAQADQIEIDPEGYHLQLGWYPAANPNGCYRLQLQKLQSNSEQEKFEYTSNKRSAIQQVIEQCLNLITEGLSLAQIQAEILKQKQQFEKGDKLFAGSRKSLEDDTVDKKNRLTYSQVGYGSVYYEITNLAYIEEKSNKMPYNTFELENQRT